MDEEAFRSRKELEDDLLLVPIRSERSVAAAAEDVAGSSKEEEGLRTRTLLARVDGSDLEEEEASFRC